MEARRHQLLQEVADRATEAAQEIGIPAEVAAHVAAAVADFLCQHWAGQQITFPLRGAFGLSPRELAIAAEVNAGARPYEIARKYEMTERGVRKLIARLQERGHVRRPADQLPLFG